MELQSALLIILAVVTPLLTVASFFIARLTAAHKKGEFSGNLIKDIDHIKKAIDDVSVEQKKINSTLNDYFERIILAKASADAVNRRIDEIKK